jgi:hypothetical protein
MKKSLMVLAILFSRRRVAALPMRYDRFSSAAIIGRGGAIR